MAYKNYEDQKAYHQEWYRRNKERIKQKSRVSNKVYKERNLNFVRDLKFNTPCADCGKCFHFSAMDFDHLSDNKEKNISRMVRESISLERIKKEIDKCEIVCSNCHRVRTWSRL